MRRKNLKLLVVALMIVGGIVVSTATSNAAPDGLRVERREPTRGASRFWTWERVKKAKPRDFVRDRSTGRFRQMRSVRSTGRYVFGTTGASWTSGGPVAATTGRVFFSLGGEYYSCSGSVVDDNGAANRSLVVTAAHCAYDEARDLWATEWIFVPDYDSSPASFDSSGSFCASTSRGCWTARSLVVSKQYADQPSFNDVAVTHDYAFAVVGTGGKKNTHLDAEVGDQQIAFTTRDNEAETWMFGYPAQGRYQGNDLVYCTGWLGYDPAMLWGTYRLPCRMTAGSSGGPWFSPFTATGSSKGTGTIFSVTSYSYGGTKALHGPFFGTETQQMFTLASTIASGNALYDQP